MFSDLFEIALYTCIFFFNISVLPRARYKIVWKKYYEEGENADYVPGYEIKNILLALLNPFNFIARYRLQEYDFMADKEILSYRSYNAIKKATYWIPKMFSFTFSLPWMVLTSPILISWWGLRFITIELVVPVKNRLSPKIESPDITAEQIKHQLAEKKAANGLPAVVPVLPPARGDWQNQVYPVPEKVEVHELIN